MRFRCYNPRCGQPPQHFEFESDIPACPRCNRQGGKAVHPLCDVHFQVIGHGPFAGEAGNFHIACEPDRPYLSLHPHDGYAATPLPQCVTCPACKGTRAWQEMMKALFPTIWSQTQAEKTKTVVDLKNDCGCSKAA